MEITTTLVRQTPGITVLDAEIEGETIKIYVAISGPDLEAVTGIVPVADFESGADVHASAIAAISEAWDKIDEVIGNMNPGDIAVFLCASAPVYGATLGLFNCGTGD